MRAESFGLPPGHGKAVDQVIDDLLGIVLCTRRQMCVFGGSQDGAVTEDFLNFEQVDAGFDQMGRIAVTPMSCTT